MLYSSSQIKMNGDKNLFRYNPTELDGFKIYIYAFAFDSIYFDFETFI